MNQIEELCAELGLRIQSAEEDRGVLVLALSDQPAVETLDQVSDALRNLGYRFVSIEFPEAS